MAPESINTVVVMQKIKKHTCDHRGIGVRLQSGHRVQSPLDLVSARIWVSLAVLDTVFSFVDNCMLCMNQFAMEKNLFIFLINHKITSTLWKHTVFNVGDIENLQKSKSLIFNRGVCNISDTLFYNQCHGVFNISDMLLFCVFVCRWNMMKHL